MGQSGPFVRLTAIDSQSTTRGQAAKALREALVAVVDGGFELVFSRALGKTVLTLKGELDAHTASTLKDDLAARIDVGDAMIILDLRGLRFIDSSGLAAIINGVKKAEGVGCEIRLSGPTPEVFKVLELAGVTRLVPVTRV